MPNEPGRRERKKQLTRRALIEAAVRLFTERGYDRTSVADIAEAADVSTRTFFLHFPTKEDVLLADAETRIELAVRAVERRPADASVRAALAEAMTSMIANTVAGDLPSGLAALRTRLVTTTPSVQARVLHTMFRAQTRIAEALRRAYPDLLDEVSSATAVGAVMGAVNAAAVTSLRAGEPPERTRAAMYRATEIALHSVDALTAPATPPNGPMDSAASTDSAALPRHRAGQTRTG